MTPASQFHFLLISLQLKNMKKQLLGVILVVKKSNKNNLSFIDNLIYILTISVPTTAQHHSSI